MLTKRAAASAAGCRPRPCRLTTAPRTGGSAGRNLPGERRARWWERPSAAIDKRRCALMLQVSQLSTAFVQQDDAAT